MGLFDRFRGKTPLEAALNRALSPGGDLLTELEKLDDLGDVEPKTRNEGVAICNAITAILDGPLASSPNADVALRKLVSLILDIADPECEALEVLLTEAIPRVAHAAISALDRPHPALSKSTVMEILNVAARCAMPDGVAAVIAAATRGVESEDYLWVPILAAFSADHPYAQLLFEKLATPLPRNFIAIALLDAANAYHAEDGQTPHPFDSDDGIARLQSYLTDPDPNRASYAVSTASALPYLTHPKKDLLLDLASNHLDPAVAIRSAWASAKSGRPEGIQTLSKLCLNVTQSAEAKAYLEDLDQSDAIPEEAAHPDFVAKAEFAAWLRHPNELGRAPDRVEITDQRTLRWPPEQSPKPFWLIRYYARPKFELDEPDEGIGIFGSLTFCHSDPHDLQRSPEDIYASHCAWELEHHRLLDIESINDSEANSDYSSVLAQWQGAPLQNPRMECIAELDASLGLPNRIVAVASATCDGEPGHAVLDGSQSRWYPNSKMPPNVSAQDIVRIHLGRNLLGFRWDINRPDWPQTPPKHIPGRQVIAVFERLLDDFETQAQSNGFQLEQLHQNIRNHVSSYLDALVECHGANRTEKILEIYQRVFRLLSQSPHAENDSLTGTFSFLRDHFSQVTHALGTTRRESQIHPLLNFFEPRWQHNSGYALLGEAAYWAGDLDRSEHLLLKLKNGLKDWQRCEEFGTLARIWLSQGKAAAARDLLVECLKTLHRNPEFKEEFDSESIETFFQNHRRTYLELFPNSDHELERLGIPKTTLN